MENNKYLNNVEPKIPNFINNRASVSVNETDRESVLGENFVNTNDLNNLQITPELIEKSVGKRKCIKKMGMAFLSGALVALLSMYGIIVHKNDKRIDDYRENYVTMENYLKNSVEREYYELDGIGKEIASSILLKSNAADFDITYEIVVGLGLASEKVNDLSPIAQYNLNEAFDYEEFNIEFEGWMEIVYDSIRDTLKEGGLINVPENLRSLLIKFGFDKNIYKYDPITGILESSRKENISDKEMIKSLLAYASSIGFRNGNSKGGR